MARFQISFTTGMVVHPPQEMEGSYADAERFAEAQLDQYAPGTRYHIRIWRKDPVYPTWASCDDPELPGC